MSVIMHKEGSSEDITCTGRINFVGRISGKTFGDATLQEGGAVSSISGDEQGNLHAPTGEHSISTGTIVVGEWQEVIMAKDEDIEKRQDFFSGSPGCWPDSTIFVPTA